VALRGLPYSVRVWGPVELSDNFHICGDSRGFALLYDSLVVSRSILALTISFLFFYMLLAVSGDAQLRESGPSRLTLS